MCEALKQEALCFFSDGSFFLESAAWRALQQALRRAHTRRTSLAGEQTGECVFFSQWMWMGLVGVSMCCGCVLECICVLFLLWITENVEKGR